MTDLSFNDPCVLFALRRESRPFLREFRPQQSFAGAPCAAQFCGPSWLTVLVLETGVGPARAEAALHWLLGQPLLEKVPYHPKLVLSAGFAGALQEGYQVGDVILATEVSNEERNRWAVPWPGDLPPGDWRPALHRGGIVTGSHLLSRPEEKRQLGQKYGAIAVDMESAAVARHCTEHNVPFGCVRVISDDVATPLSPALVPILSGAHVSSLRLLRMLATAPRLLAEMMRLARDTRRAAEQLGMALGELLTLTLPWGKEL